MRLAKKEDNPRFWEAAKVYGKEAIEHAEEELRRGVDGIPIPSVPWLAMWSEAARPQMNSNKGYHWRCDQHRQTAWFSPVTCTQV
jgi:hypothetical protein